MPSLDFTTMDGETMLHTLEQYCTENGASDIHLSPQKDGVRVEWRLHGVLRSLAIIPPVRYQDFLRRVKFEAKMKLNLTNVPQDGQYTFEAKGRAVNMRAATLPSRFGEALTLRLLDPQRGILPLEKLGFPEDIRTKLATLVEMPHGLVLVTGPTGSGKTTTLYALLSTIIGKERNIITLEDPVEYELPGIIQSEIDVEHEYTFANGLRSILRHDPDVILVGEIRDLETAQTAVNASLTGHLVLTTLHTNSAVEAIPRLLSMGVSPYTFAPALRAVVAQRLIRTLTDACKTGATPCDPSSHDTYGGQMVLPELLTISPAIQQLILNVEQTSTIFEQARKEGFRTMKEWGDQFVQEKRTTKEEIARVVA
ncbi:MAG: GspE/PulE family protein [Candidatus Peregrinibacteria bacterium]|nr:GspE/PulE family protein [Candidatus Peregrinibacteria bacterium]